MLDAGCSMLDARYWMLDTGCSMLDTRYWIFDKNLYPVFPMERANISKKVIPEGREKPFIV
jgi:hypothetical protein